MGHRPPGTSEGRARAHLRQMITGRGVVRMGAVRAVDGRDDKVDPRATPRALYPSLPKS